LILLGLFDDVVDDALDVAGVRLSLDRAVGGDQAQDFGREASAGDRCDKALVDQVEDRIAPT
jgi:hypothetical protein